MAEWAPFNLVFFFLFSQNSRRSAYISLCPNFSASCFEIRQKGVFRMKT